MKKRFVKGILAATLALVSVVGVPQSQKLNGMLSPSVTVSAACSHNYRHYYDYSQWVPIRHYVRYDSTGFHYYTQYRRYVYSVCVNCGKKEYVKTEFKVEED